MLVILSIKPKYADAILSGKKKCEFRKTPFLKKVNKVILYSSSPINKIVGWFEIKNQITGKPSTIWRKYSKNAGITRKEFFDYYDGSESAVCIEIKKVNRFKSPIDPFVKKNNFIVPQSFRYVNGNDYSLLKTVVPDFQFQQKL